MGLFNKRSKYSLSLYEKSKNSLFGENEYWQFVAIVVTALKEKQFVLSEKPRIKGTESTFDVQSGGSVKFDSWLFALPTPGINCFMDIELDAAEYKQLEAIIKQRIETDELLGRYEIVYELNG